MEIQKVRMIFIRMYKNVIAETGKEIAIRSGLFEYFRYDNGISIKFVYVSKENIPIVPIL